MSSSYNTYLGPYLEVIKRKVQVKEEGYGCPMHPSLKYKISDSFCLHCGTKLETLFSNRKGYPHFYDLLTEEYADELCHVPNDRLEKLDIIFSNEALDYLGDFDAVEVTTKKMEERMEEFKERYKDIISMFEDKCETVKLKYGVVTYWH